MKKLLNFRPILFIAISLCLGIASTYFYLCDNLVWAIFLSCVFLVSNIIYLILYANKNNLKEKLIFVCVFLMIFIVGSQGLINQISSYDKADLDGRIFNITARISQATESDYGKKLILDNAIVKSYQTKKLDYKISVNCYGENDFDVGDVVQFKANLYDNNYLYEQKFNVYDIEKGIKYHTSVSSEDIKVVDNKLTVFEKINLFIRDNLKKGLGEREFSVGYALLTGNSNFMDYDLVSSYRNAGVAHIFAVSGLHIGFLATVLTFLFKKININKTLKAIIITLILFLFSGVCGFSASSLRASVMTAVSLFAYAIGKRYDGITATSLSAILILLVSPTQLMCVGFQLSFMVVLGIILLANPIARFITKTIKVMPKKLATSIGVVISAQLFSMPISLYAFGEFSIISVIINLIFIPVVSVIFTLTLFAVLIGGLFNIANILLLPSNYIFKFINVCITAFDYDIFMVGGFVFGGAIIGYYLVCVIASGFMNIKHKMRFLTCAIMILVSVSSIFIVNVTERNKVSISVSYVDSLSTTLISTDKENTLIVSDINYVFSMAKLSRCSVYCGDRLDNVIVMGGYPIDLQVFLSKISSVFEVGQVCYYGQKQEVMERICKKSFPKTKISNYFDGQLLPIEQFDFRASLQGCAITSIIRDKKICVLSALEFVKPNLNDLDSSFDIMVCYDRSEVILNKYSPSIGVSYKYTSKYANAQESGNMLFKLN
ncbi:MAG: ComEC family competence protein [Clostridiales bacterium]|nr:ComEC family competence protein [Clostridiales bacterium]